MEQIKKFKKKYVLNVVENTLRDPEKEMVKDVGLGFVLAVLLRIRRSIERIVKQDSKDRKLENDYITVEDWDVTSKMGVVE